jgi:hypothetical protein
MISLKILKFLYFLITFTVWLVAYNNGIYCINEHGLYTKRFVFRKFGIKFDSVNSDKISLREIFDEKLEKHKDELKKMKLLKKDKLRQSIYARHLLKFQGGSNVLKDFHTNRF